ncbi:MAG: serine hydrolase [Bacteroidota bacterium]
MKKILVLFFLLILLLSAAFRFYLYPRLPILNGHAAKTLCSCVFVAGIPEEKAIAEDIGFFPVSMGSKIVDYDTKSVTANFWGFKPKTAYYRGGLGCAFFNEGKPNDESMERKVEIPDTLKNWFDYVDTVAALNDRQKKALDAALTWAFTEKDPEQPTLITRAVAIVYKGQLVGEKYAPGFTKESRLLGWSMTKTVTAALYGLLEKNNRLSLDDPLNVTHWEGTDKEKLRIRHLLNMSSGMEWEENYNDRSSVTKMLYESANLGLTASQTELVGAPGQKWYYSSGTSNILSYALAGYFPDQRAYQRFPYDSLFARLGMSSMIIETDAAGYFIGSSYSWATARDWAKFGVLLLNEGAFAGDTLLNPSWVKFMTTPVADSENSYGGHLWLNADGQMGDVPDDAFYANGFHGQRITVIPSKDLVIVRLGETYTQSDFDFNQWTRQVIDAIEQE